MTAIAALPPPSAFGPASGSSGLGRLKTLLMSEAIPVTPVQPIPGEQQRRRQEPEIEATEDSVGRGGRAGTSDGRRRAGGAGDTGGGGFAAGGGDERGPVTASPVPLTAGPTAGYVAQTIAQEAIGTGLHIEPWGAALAAYRRAESGPSMPLVSRFSV
ncbi:hypothetical protein [Azospirillum halopraeferens]|uniref:hypothetical protein n=1 Tax=Azospirillum halopraeferens TaxID=34010 RepID=UPI0004241347|nr:hypothetical protein [Azospirillum halopraeferens]